MGTGIWQDLIAALGLMLVLEGIGPFLAPQRIQHAYAQAAQLSPRTLRIVGMVSMLLGAVLVSLAV